MSNNPSSLPPTERVFACAVCGRQAGCVYFGWFGGELVLARSSFTSELAVPLRDPVATEEVREAVSGGDLRALHRLHPDVPSFYCPKCDQCFCGEHWTTWDVFDDDGSAWYDSTWGRCPHGHERRLED